MGFMALTVRTPRYYQNRINLANWEETGADRFNHTALPRFNPADDRSLKPDVSLELDTEYGGVYWIAGDLTGDGAVEIVSAKYYVEFPDVNRVASLAVQDLSGKRLWHWKSDAPAPANLGMGRGSSAAMAVYNLSEETEKGRLLMATDGFLISVRRRHRRDDEPQGRGRGGLRRLPDRGQPGRTGQKKHSPERRLPHNPGLRRESQPSLEGKESRRAPPGPRIAAVDLDNDGADEIITGSVILNGDGSVRTRFRSDSIQFWYGGHVDGIVPIRQNGEWYVGVTYCDASGMALYTEDGTNLWELTGDHYEYLVGGYFFPDNPELKNQFQLISKIHYKEGNPQLMVNQDGRVLTLFNPAGAVFAADWTGDGYHELIFSGPASIYSGTVKLFDPHLPAGPDGYSLAMRVADFIGRRADNTAGFALEPDGIPDIGVRT